MNEFRRLFQPIKIAKTEIPNRIVFPATGTHFAEGDGTVSDRLVNFLLRRARGGVGLIVVEYTEIDETQQASRRALQIFDDRFIEGLSRLTRSIKKEGAAVAIQLHHPGRYSDHRISRRQAVAPSAVRSRILREAPRELTEEEISTLVDRFVQGVRRAKEAGFDAVELHAASGYLLNQFFSPLTNLRDDAWGGDTERRCRFAKEIVMRAKEEVGPDFPIILRLAVDEYIDGGLTIEESTRIVQIMESVGVASISVTAGTHDSTKYSTGQVAPSIFFPPGIYTGLSKSIKKVALTPVMVAGRINTLRLAERVLEDNRADLICMCRALICDPDLPRKALEGKRKEIRRCLYDNTCLDAIVRGVPGAELVCLLNPEVGREYLTEPDITGMKRVLVLGGYPAGLEAARIARLRGYTVALFEANPRLGGRWSWTIDPYVVRLRRLLENVGVDIRLGSPVSLKDIQEWRPDIVIASRPFKEASPPVLGIEDGKHTTAEDVFSGESSPEGAVLVMGGNNIGLEVAELLAKKRNQVILVDEGWLGRGIATIMRQHHFDKLTRRGVTLCPKTRLRDVTNHMVSLIDVTGNEYVKSVDWIVTASLRDIDNSPLEWLEGQAFEVIYVNPAQSPREWSEGMREGTAIARRL